MATTYSWEERGRRGAQLIFYKLFKNCGNLHNLRFTALTVFDLRFSDVKRIHSVVRLPPPVPVQNLIIFPNWSAYA